MVDDMQSVRYGPLARAEFLISVPLTDFLAQYKMHEDYSHIDHAYLADR